MFLLFGSSAAGKTFVLDELRGRVAELVIHDFDEIGVPSGADTAWRHRADEEWVRRALEYQSVGSDLLLAGQTPFGELLSAPSAPQLEAVSACLIDCDDDTRVARLQARGPEWFARSAGDLQAYLNWATWMRGHARARTGTRVLGAQAERRQDTPREAIRCLKRQLARTVYTTLRNEPLMT